MRLCSSERRLSGRDGSLRSVSANIWPLTPASLASNCLNSTISPGSLFSTSKSCSAVAAARLRLSWMMSAAGARGGGCCSCGHAMPVNTKEARQHSETRRDALKFIRFLFFLAALSLPLARKELSATHLGWACTVRIGPELSAPPTPCQTPCKLATRRLELQKTRRRP